MLYQVQNENKYGLNEKDCPERKQFIMFVFPTCSGFGSDGYALLLVYV